MTNRREFIQKSAAFTLTGAVLPGFGASKRDQRVMGPETDQFFVAVASGDLESVRSQLAARKDLINAKDTSGRSGFAVALLNGHRSVADLVLATGYECDIHESALALDWDRFEELAAKSGDGVSDVVNRFHPIGGTALFAAAAGGAGTGLWRVYAQGGNPDLVGEPPHQISPVQRALRVKDLPLAELTAAAMLSNNASPNLKGRNDAAPIHIAIERGSPEIVELLIQTGVDLTVKNDKGETAIESARHCKHQRVREIMEHLDEIPCVVYSSRTACDKDGTRYRAPDWGEISVLARSRVVGNSHLRFENVRKAVDRDPRLAHSVATTGEICVEAAAHMGQKKIVDYLLGKGAPYSLPTAVMMDDLTTVKKLLAEDPQRIHERGAHFFALLWYAAIGRCRLEMTEYLLAQGAVVEQQHFLGTTALHFACMFGNIELVELLIENGANVNRVGRKFRGQPETPMQRTRDTKVIQLLKSKGAKQ